MASRMISAEYTFAAIFIIVFHIIIASRIAIGGITADLSLILTVWIALEKPPRTSLIFGFITGILIGVLSPSDIGWAALLLALTGYFLSNLKYKIVMEALPIRIGSLFVIAFTYQFIFLSLSRFAMLSSDPSYLLINSLFSAIYTTIIGTMIYLFIEYRHILRNIF